MAGQSRQFWPFHNLKSLERVAPIERYKNRRIITGRWRDATTRPCSPNPGTVFPRQDEVMRNHTIEIGDRRGHSFKIHISTPSTGGELIGGVKGDWDTWTLQSTGGPNVTTARKYDARRLEDNR